MKQMAVLTLTLIMATSHALAAIEKHSAAYAGGTIARLNALGGSNRHERSPPPQRRARGPQHDGARRCGLTRCGQEAP
jgi:hypothetical protein